MSILGDRIKEYRLRRDLTQDEIAERLGMKRSNFSSYETGRTIPPSNVLSELSTILKATTDYLLGKTDVNLYEWIPEEEARETQESPASYHAEAELYAGVLDLSNEEVKEKYAFRVDGREISQEEFERMIAAVRADRLYKDQHRK